MITINDITPKDIPDLLYMIRALCAFHGDPCPRGLEDTQRQFIDGPMHGLIARNGRQPVGYAALQTRWRPTDKGDAVWVDHLYLIEEMRGRGIGTQLVTKARDWAISRGASRLCIGAHHDNVAAATAYRAMGWEKNTSPSGPTFRMILEE